MRSGELSEKGKRSFEGMDSAGFAEKWKRSFAANVPAEIMAEYIDAKGCFLWHAFTWGKAPCLERAAAQEAFDAADKTDAFIAEESSFDGGGKNIVYSFRRCPPDLKSRDLADKCEVFVVGKNFRWTYVVTHEGDCGLGPYFAEKQSKVL